MWKFPLSDYKAFVNCCDDAETVDNLSINALTCLTTYRPDKPVRLQPLRLTFYRRFGNCTTPSHDSTRHASSFTDSPI